MKKLFALIIALLMLTACGAEAEPTAQNQPKTTTPVETVPMETVPAETEPEPTMSPEGYFVEEITKDDGTKVIRHRLNSIKGKVIWSRTENPNGTFEEKTNNQDGKLISEKFSDADGVIYEKEYYDYGALRITITQFPDGSSSEIHYDADSYFDGRVNHPGTVVYKKNVAADGQVTEEGWPLSKIVYELDGSWWETTKTPDGSESRFHYAAGYRCIESIYLMPDGSKTETFYNDEGIPVRQTSESITYGYTIETEFYESGATKKDVWTYTNSNQYRCNEFYENGLTKNGLTIYEDGTEIEEQCNEQGYYTYYRRKDQYGQREYFAGENNELVKYIEEGTVYEGDTLTENQINVFKQMQNMAAEVAYNILNGI